MTFPRAQWRLLYTPPADGATNMAIDEAIMLSVADGTSLPTLRFYTWSPPCLSLGYAQDPQEVIDLEACRTLGYTWVRRPTGGRAVLHIDELTYSITAPQSDPRMHGGILPSYKRISAGLIAGLRRLNILAEQVPHRPNHPSPSAACFEVPSYYEIAVDGRKLIGSAQTRRRGVVLQHGSLPLYGDVARIVDVLQLTPPQRASLRQTLRARATTLTEAAGRPLSFDEVAAALTQGISEVLNLELIPGELTALEKERADHLREVRYNTEASATKQKLGR